MVHINQSNVAAVVLILILVAINLVLLINGMNLDCGECTVTFTNHRVAGANVDFPEVKVTLNELWEAYDEGYCIIKWDRVQGFYRA